MDNALRVILKSLLVFALLAVLTRFIGRELLSQMSFFEFIIGITMGSISGSYITQVAEGLLVLISPVVLTITTIAFGYMNIKILKVRRITEGEPVVIIQNGKILDRNMTRLRYHIDDLEMQLRDKGIFNLTDVEFAVLEPHGQLSVLKKSQKQPVTPEDLNLQTQYKGLAVEIIKDGKIIRQNLMQNKLTMDWLYQELKKRKIESASDVFYATLNTDGILYIDLFEDTIRYTQKIED